jgi:hypothetical protein
MSFTSFQDFKTQIMGFTGLEKDALHIYVGIGVFLITSFLFRRSRYRWLIALVMVMIAASMGEIWDRYESLSQGASWNKGASLHDFVNTCFFPTLFTLILTFTHFFERNIAQAHGSKH